MFSRNEFLGNYKSCRIEFIFCFTFHFIPEILMSTLAFIIHLLSLVLWIKWHLKQYTRVSSLCLRKVLKVYLMVHNLLFFLWVLLAVFFKLEIFIFCFWTVRFLLSKINIRYFVFALMPQLRKGFIIL